VLSQRNFTVLALSIEAYKRLSAGKMAWVGPSAATMPVEVINEEPRHSP